MLKVWQTVVGVLHTNCWVAADSDTRQALVVDPGDAAPRILALLRQERLEAQYIFLTHGHFDHVLALETLRAHAGAPVLLHAADAPLLIDPALSSSMAGGGPLARSADIPLAGGETFPLGAYTLTVLHTPGHTPGSCCLSCEDPSRRGAPLSERVLFTGDTLFEGDCGRCDLPGGDYGQMLQSLWRLSELPGDRTVCPGHDAATTLEQERRHNRNMREAMGANKN